MSSALGPEGAGEVNSILCFGLPMIAFRYVLIHEAAAPFANDGEVKL